MVNANSPEAPPPVFDVSIIIVTWNSEGYIRQCLESIYQFTKNNSFEIIVVDNGSTDKSADIIEREFLGPKTIRAGANFGFPKATNSGIRLSKGRFICLLNPDTVFKSDVVKELVDFMEIHPEAGAISPKMLESDGSVNSFGARQFPALGNILFTEFGLRRLFPHNRLFAKAYLGDWDRQSVASVPCLNGAALMIPRSVLAEVGFLDEQIPMYFEDIDICARINAIGKKLYYVPSAILVHMSGRSASLSPAKSLLIGLECGQAPWAYFLKYRGCFQARLFTLIIFVSSLFRVALFWGGLAIFGSGKGQTYLEKKFEKALALLEWSLSSKADFVDHASRVIGFSRGPESAGDYILKPAQTHERTEKQWAQGAGR